MPGLDKLGAGAVGELTLRPAVARLRALRAARRFRRTRGTPAAVSPAPATRSRRCARRQVTTCGGGGDRPAGSDHAVQAEPVRPRLGVPGEPRVQDRPRVQAVPVRARVQGRRGVAFSRAGRLVCTRAHVQRAQGLRQGVPVHQEGHREMSTGALLADAVLLAGWQAHR